MPNPVYIVQVKFTSPQKAEMFARWMSQHAVHDYAQYSQMSGQDTGVSMFVRERQDRDLPHITFINAMGV
jgi:hypothetical protein